jgi:putative endonuclease
MMERVKLGSKPWVVYLLRCSNNSMYCGISNDLENRLSKHNSGKGAKYRRSRLPVELVNVSAEMSRSEALRLENYIKMSPAHEKVSVLERGEVFCLAK